MRREGLSVIIIVFIAGLLSAPTGGVRSSASPAQGTVPQTRTQRERGQPPPFHADIEQHLRFKHLTLDDGLSQISINCILQDAQGFMWFGTQDGLNKYDGYDFTVYKPIPGENSLGDNYIRALYESQDGVLWVGTDGGGLDRFDRNRSRFLHYRSDPHDSHSLSNEFVYAIVPGQGDDLWIATLGGLDRFDPETERFYHHRHRPGDPNSLSSNNVSCLCRDWDGSIWAGTDAGLNRLDPDTGIVKRYQQYPHGLSGDDVQAIYQDPDGTLWVGTDQGLHRFNSLTERFTLYQPMPGRQGNLNPNVVHAIIQDGQGSLWVGTESGLNRFDPEAERFHRYVANGDEPDGLSNDFILAIHQDAEGNLWFGTYGGGINHTHPATASFLHVKNDLTDPHSLASDFVWSIYQDRRGALWVGMAGAGLDRWEPGTGGFAHYRPRPDDASPETHSGLSDGRVRAILEDEAGRLWLGTEHGLNVLDRETERFTRYMHDPDDPHSVSSNAILEIYQDSQGRLWIGTFGGGLNRADPDTGRFTQYPSVSGSHPLHNAVVWSVLEDEEGALWIGTGGGGLHHLDLEQGRVTTHGHDPEDPQSLSSPGVLALHQDQEGMLWLGTAGGGLNRFDKDSETFTAYRERDGLPNDVVYGILEDDQGNLWLSTNRGLARFDPRSETFRTYDVQDGLQSNEFNAGAYYRNAAGWMFFGGINGFNAFHPNDVQVNDYVPPVILTSLTQGGESIAPARELDRVEAITLRWPNNYFEFEFAALSFRQPQKNRYAYVLEGFDTAWNRTEGRRFGRYTNLPGGIYTLRVKGANNDGIWNEQGTALAVQVVPPFWGTLWFRGALGLLLAGAAIAGYRLRVRGMKARSRQLEIEVANRTRELSSLNAIAAVVSRSFALEDVLADALDETLAAMDVEAGGIYALDEAASTLNIVVQQGFDPQFLRAIDGLSVGEGFSGRVARSGEPLVVSDIAEDPRLTRMVVQEQGLHALAVVPLSVKGKVLGTLFVVTRTYRAFSERDVQLLVAIGQQIGVALENARLYEQAQRLAVVEERQRLARELHDSVTQALYGTTLYAEAAARQLETGEAELATEHLHDLRDTAREALREMRLLIFELRPSILESAGLVNALRARLEAVEERAGLEVSLSMEGKGMLSSAMEEGLYRIAQEALNNTLKHAYARRVKVRLLERDGVVVLEIVDDGCGFDPGTAVAGGGLGLKGMMERAAQMGGQLVLDSEPGAGTRVRIDVPL